MCKTSDNKYAFSFLEMISTRGDGKTSATGTIGVMLCLLSMLMIAIIFFFYFFNVGEANNVLEFLDKCIIILGIGATLLGCRKVSGAICQASSNKAASIVKELEQNLNNKEKEE